MRRGARASTTLSFVGDPEPILREVENFVAGIAGAPSSDRQLSTVLFTDIVGSTQLCS